MNTEEREFWKEVVEEIKQDKWKNVHKNYSSADGWLVLSGGRGDRRKLTYENTWFEIMESLKHFS